MSGELLVVSEKRLGGDGEFFFELLFFGETLESARNVLVPSRGESIIS
jgi:hypothetical protein